MRHLYTFVLITGALIWVAPQAAERNSPQAQSDAPAAQAAPPRAWVDPDTGHRIVRLTDEPGSASLYFHQNAYTADGRKMIYTTPKGISVLDLKTYAARLVVEGRVTVIVTGRKTQNVYYAKEGAVWSTDVDTGASREIGKLPPRGSVSTVNADETLLAGTYTEGAVQPANAAQPPQPSQPQPQPQPQQQPLTQPANREGTLEQRFAARTPMGLFIMNAKTGEVRTIHKATDWLNHLQFSPTDPTLLMFCHEGPWHKLDRIWTIRTDGSQLKKIHTRTVAMEIWGHESWSADGKTIWYDLQTPRGEVFWLAGYNIESGERTWYHLQRNEWSIHFNATRDGTLFCGDGGDEGQVARAPDGKWIYLFRPELIPNRGIEDRSFVKPGVLRAERLVNMSKHNYRLEPNVSFTPDQQWVVFRSNMFGPTYVFAVEVARAQGSGPGVSAGVAQPGRAAPKPFFRDPVYDGAADPVLVWSRGEKKWLMFYTNRRANVPGLAGVTWVHGTRIGMAESSDGGAAWKYAGTAGIDYGKPDYTHWAPEIIDHNGAYHMYLSIVPGIFADWNAGREIVHLTSQDLRKWKYESTLDLNSDRVIDATVIQLPNGAFRMWYKDERAKDGSLYYADSPDLYRWTSKGNAIPKVGGEGPKVFRWKNRYWLIADVWDGIAVFSSSDCLAWVRQPENILKEPGVLATDRSKGGHADVVVSGERAYIFYFVHQGQEAEAATNREWQRHTVIQAAELEYRDGTITCDRNKPAHIALQPPAASAAERPLASAPVPAVEKLRNDKAGVMEFTLKPGEAVSLEGRHPAVTAYINSGSLEFRLPGGVGNKVSVSRGEVAFDPAQARKIGNAGSSELTFVRTEFLTEGGSETWGTTGLAPDSRLLMENQYTRVYNIRIPAGAREPQHTHKARVVVCLSGAILKHLMPDGREEPSTLKTGEVAWRPGATHIGQNLGTTDLWVIAIEPK